MGPNLTAHLLALLMAFVFTSSMGQSIRQFTVDDGLPSAHVYEVKQDSKGFYWIATSEGLVRYDGYNFEPIGEGNSPFNRDIWWSFEGIDGKIWGLGQGNKLPFFKSDTFGVINPSIPNTDETTVFGEGAQDKFGIIWLKLGSYFYGLKNDSLIHTTILSEINQTPPIAKPKLFLEDSIVYLIGHTPVSVYQLGIEGPQLVQEYPLTIWYKSYLEEQGKMNEANTTLIPISTDSMYLIHDKTLTLLANGIIKDLGEFPASELLTQESYIVYPVQDKFVFLSSEGNFVVDRSFNHLPQFNFIDDFTINTVFVDHENNLWLSTVDQGLICISQDAMASTTILENESDNSEVVGIEISEDAVVWVSYRNGTVCNLQNGISQCEKQFPETILNPSWQMKITSLWKGQMVLALGNYELNFGATDNFFDPSHTDTTILLNGYNSGLKQFCLGADGNLYVSDYHRSFRFSDPESPKPEIVADSKVLCASAFKSGEPIISSYAGTFYINTKKDTVFLSTDVFVSKMEVDPNNNIVLLRKGRGLGIATKKEITVVPQLGPYIINDVFCESPSIMWAATNHGLIELSVSGKEFSIERTYTTANGIPTNDIKCVAVDSQFIYVGSSHGLTTLNRKELSVVRSTSNLVLKGVYSTTDTLKPASTYKLAPEENSIRFDYVCISPKSQGKITYHYKLDGLNSDWNKTDERTISYPYLPAGNYTFHLKATDINGMPSNQQLIIPIHIEQYWYKTAWFLVILNFCLILAAIIAYRYRITAIRKKESEQTELNARLADLKLSALRSQMNPHFVFNVLNSIQESFLSRNLEEANQHLSDFSKLMRLFLETSGHRYISVRKEISILRPYIMLECMRLENKFDFSIQIDDEIDPDEVYVPSMLIQPIIENAIVHGLKYKKNGLLAVNMSIDNNDKLTIVIEDNGIGRERSAEINSKRNPKHQSKASQIIEERIALLNLSPEDSLVMEIIDLESAGDPAGTKVILHMSLSKNK